VPAMRRPRDEREAAWRSARARGPRRSEQHRPLVVGLLVRVGVMDCEARVIRVLSYSEIEKALTCQAQWDFRYGDRLAGSSLKPKAIAPGLSNGRAWGAAVAAYHANVGDLALEQHAPIEALEESLKGDIQRMLDFGLYVFGDYAERANKIEEVFEHYRATTEPLPVEALEREILVPLPSRTGVRPSSRYRLQAFVDAVHVDDSGHEWLVEYKFRGKLHPLELLERSRQIRWYAWAAREALDLNPRGVIVDQRLNEPPKPALIVNARRKGEGIDGKTVSHKKDQLTTAGLYEEACWTFGAEPEPDTLAALEGRTWQTRHTIMFRRGELEEAGEELVSAARDIHELDAGIKYPIRNAKTTNCNYCDFRRICADPMHSLEVDATFERKPAKRDRHEQTEEVVAA
jgi:hypothetical protein